MDNKLDTYFRFAKSEELPVSISEIEKLVSGFTVMGSTSIIKSLFIKHPILMNTITAFISVGLATLLSFSLLNINSTEPQIHQRDTEVVGEEINSDNKTERITLPAGKKTENRESLPVIIVENEERVSKEKISAHSYRLKSQMLNIEPVIPVMAKIDLLEGNNYLMPIQMAAISGFDEISDFIYNDGLWAMVYDDGAYGMVDKELNVVVPIIYDEIRKKFDYNDGLWCLVYSDGHYGFIDRIGKEVVKTIYDEVSHFKYNDGQWLLVYSNGHYGFINRDGDEVVEPKYDEIGTFRENDGLWAEVYSNGHFGYIDREGNEIVETKYDEIGDFKENDGLWAKVYSNGHYGFIDREGKEVVPLIYDEINDFTENDGLWAAVYRDGEIFYIDREGNEVSAGK